MFGKIPLNRQTANFASRRSLVVERVQESPERKRERIETLPILSGNQFAKTTCAGYENYLFHRKGKGSSESPLMPSLDPRAVPASTCYRRRRHIGLLIAQRLPRREGQSLLWVIAMLFLLLSCISAQQRRYNVRDGRLSLHPHAAAGHKLCDS